MAFPPYAAQAVISSPFSYGSSTPPRRLFISLVIRYIIENKQKAAFILCLDRSRLTRIVLSADVFQQNHLTLLNLWGFLQPLPQVNST